MSSARRKYSVSRESTNKQNSSNNSIETTSSSEENQSVLNTTPNNSNTNSNSNSPSTSMIHSLLKRSYETISTQPTFKTDGVWDNNKRQNISPEKKKELVLTTEERALKKKLYDDKDTLYHSLQFQEGTLNPQAYANENSELIRQNTGSLPQQYLYNATPSVSSLALSKNSLTNEEISQLLTPAMSHNISQMLTPIVTNDISPTVTPTTNNDMSQAATPIVANDMSNDISQDLTSIHRVSPLLMFVNHTDFFNDELLPVLSSADFDEKQPTPPLSPALSTTGTTEEDNVNSLTYRSSRGQM
jgi:hypothetical protein